MQQIDSPPPPKPQNLGVSELTGPSLTKVETAHTETVKQDTEIAVLPSLAEDSRGRNISRNRPTTHAVVSQSATSGGRFYHIQDDPWHAGYGCADDEISIGWNQSCSNLNLVDFGGRRRDDEIESLGEPEMRRVLIMRTVRV